MAKQSGIIKLKGTIGDISFYKSKDGYLAREKGGVDKDRIMNDEAFQRTRENGAEFGRAGTAGRILRTAFRTMLLKASDSRLTSRLTKQMMKVIQADTTNTRGERTVVDGDLAVLEGLEFNANASLIATVYAPYVAAIDRLTGEATIDVEAFVPSNSIVAPNGSTHFKFISAAAEVDFENESFILKTASTAEIELGVQNEAAVNLTNALTAESELPLFLIFGVEFFQEVNGVFYPMNSGKYNALTLVEVDVA